MSNEASQKKEEGGGAPAWVMTFADLMSLLMCFFVLLLSFAEMDLNKFKQIAGSMKNAFGVQREIKVKEPPKGTSVIAREFSPGRPTPTPINEIRQITINENEQTLEFTDAVTGKKEAESMEAGEQDDGSETAPLQEHSEPEPSEKDLLESGQDPGELQQLATMSRQMNQDLREMTGEINDNLPEQAPDLEKISKLSAEIENQITGLLNKDKDKEENSDVSMEAVNEQSQVDARKLMQTLAPEIEKGMVSVDTHNNRIVLRIKEKGSFPSGSSDLQSDFIPVIDKLKNSLQTIEGRVIVAGHTDNVPIKTHRFRSNWDLSSSRAVSVVHELLHDSNLKPNRFAVEGHGDAQPVVPNTSAENRAVNRRVELTIIQGEGAGKVSELSMEEAGAGTAPDTVIHTNSSEEDTDQVLQGNADENMTEGEELSPVTDALEPLLQDPFAGIMEQETDTAETTGQAENESEYATIDIENLQKKSNTVSEGLNKDTSEEGQQE